ncbi:MAG TPA: MmcQ/YjbR family DNA-binding protein [Clostridiaceae bacterium]|nr:MmcQ/YjbR family DNA-binding protein [Clostridiaceae bacterium]
MQIEEITKYCLNKNKAYIDYPFGDIPICFKVNNKLFAQLYPLEDDYKITLKCDVLLAELYRKQYKDIVVKGYHCPPIQAAHFNTVYINEIDEKVLLEMIDHSYDIVVKSFSKKIQKEILGENDE